MTTSKHPFLPLLACLLAFPWMALAEDLTPALPPPANVPDTPAARETVEPPAESPGANLGKELSPPGKESDVEVHAYKRKDGTKVEEYSRHGRVYMIKVSPPGDMPPYYLYKGPNGKFARRLPGGYKYVTPPEWVIQRF